MSRVDAWLSFGGEFDYVLRSSWLSKGTRKPKKASWTHGPCLGGGGGNFSKSWTHSLCPRGF